MPLLQLLSDADAAGNLQSEGIVVLKDVSLTELSDGRIYFEVPPHIELHGTIDGAVHVGLCRGGLKPNHPDAAVLTIGKDKVSIATYHSNKPASSVPDDQIIDMPVLSFNAEYSQLQQQLSLLNQRRYEAKALSIRTIGEALRDGLSTSTSSSTRCSSQIKWLKSQYPDPEAAFQLVMIHQAGMQVTDNERGIGKYLVKALIAGHVGALLHFEALNEDQLKNMGLSTNIPRSYYQLHKLYTKDAVGVLADAEKAKKYLMLYAKCPDSDVPLEIVDGKFSKEMISQFLSDPTIEFRVGLHYLNGTKLTSTDLGKVMLHFTSAADKGDAKAQYQCGMFYLQGLMGQKDLKKAAEYFTYAAKSKHAEARYELAMLKW